MLLTICTRSVPWRRVIYFNGRRWQNKSIIRTMETQNRGLTVPFLRSCKQESPEPIVGAVKGEIPGWLNGSLIRVGSGLLEIGKDKFQHLFDGLALLHRFSIRLGQVTYQNRFLRSDTYNKDMKANRIAVSEFGTRASPDPCKTIFHRYASLFSTEHFTDNDLVNIVQYSDEFYACSESNFIWRIDPENLNSLQKVNLSKFVAVNTATAHPHEDKDGTVYNIGLGGAGFKATYHIIKFSPKAQKGSNAFEEGSVVCRIPSSHALSPCYFHSFGMSEKFFVFLEQPLVMSMPKLMWAHFTYNSYADCMQWLPQEMARLHVVRRDTGELLPTRYLAPPFMVFHHINTYEADGHLVVDMCCYKDGSVVKSLYVSALEEYSDHPNKANEPFKSEARRYVLPLNITNEKEKTGNLIKLVNCQAKAERQKDGSILCEPECLTGTDPWAPELPRINYEDNNGIKYQYFYAIAKKDNFANTSLIKVDTDNRTTLQWSEEEAIPSEPVFVKDPASLKDVEDGGVLLASLLYKNNDQKVSLLVLDAKTMTEIGRVDFATVSSVPGDFHGIFIQNS